jgi:crotonobetainyl-CoA:carnitine CoA-transferase CaiB-like acyl-CoA transferase
MYNNRVNGRPVRGSLAYYDMAAGLFAVVGIFAALGSPVSVDSARRIDVPLYETGLYLVSAHVVTDQSNHPPAPSVQSRSDFDFPGYGTYETSDGRWIYLIMLSDEHWDRFANAMALPEEVRLAYSTSAQRRECSFEVEGIVSSELKALSFDEAAERLRMSRAGYEEVLPPNRVLEHVQLQQSGKTAEVPFEDHVYKLPTFPLGESSESGEVPGLPHLGQHSMEILTSIGYTKYECDSLLAEGVVRMR